MTSFIINLDRDRARLAGVLDRYEASGLRAAGIGVARFPAVDARQLGDPVRFVSPQAEAQLRETMASGTRVYHHDLTPGAVGCFLSHVALLRRLVADPDHDAYLVLEDDVRLPDGLGARLRHVVRAAPQGWDLLLLGVHWGVFEEVEHAEFKRVKRFWGTFAMLVSKEGAAKILREYERVGIDMQVDSMMSLMAMRGALNVFATRDDLVPSLEEHGTNIQVPLRAVPGVDPFDLMSGRG